MQALGLKESLHPFGYWLVSTSRPGYPGGVLRAPDCLPACL
jgi:hypothetical protein